MTLYWPGDSRATDVFTDAALATAVVDVENAWLAGLVAAGIAPSSAQVDLAALWRESDVQDLDDIAADSEAGGNPVIPLLAHVRAQLGPHDAAHWLHRGLTSQDTLDTALMLLTKHALGTLVDQLRAQVGALCALSLEHRDTLMVARTLTQFALPYTFGAKVAMWLRGVLDAAAPVPQVQAALSVQIGGAVGTRAAIALLSRARVAQEPPRDGEALASAAEVVTGLVADVAARLGLRPAQPWHTTRAPVTRVGDTLVGLTDAWAHIANDVVTLGRPEIGELSEPRSPGRGGSSTMPHKVNPVLSLLVRRAALTTPGLAAQLHLAAADTGDERPAGAWHVEWATLRDLVRRTTVASGQLGELLRGLNIHADRMAANLAAAGDDVVSERRALAQVIGEDPAGDEHYLGTAAAMVEQTVQAARSWLAVEP